jgi:arylsulfatase A-like enzyme
MLKVFQSSLLISHILVVTSLFIAAPNIHAAEQSNKKQNVLILMFDDMRFDTFSYRDGPVKTPNIDSLAREGTRFDNAMTSTGLCSPSRAALFTGRWGHKTGLDDNVWLYHSRLSELPPEEPGIIKQAVAQDYFVGYIGKWHLGANGPALRGAEYTWGKEHNMERFKRQWVPKEIVKRIDHYKAGGTDANSEKHMYYQTLEGSYEDTPTSHKVVASEEMFAKAAKDDRPFFGVISFEQPHPPYRVPEPYASMFDPSEVKKPKNHRSERINKPMSQDDAWWPWHDVSHMSEKDWLHSRAYYYGAIAMIDRAIGEIIASAKQHGLYEDLNIMVIGDQGSMLGEHDLYDKGPYAYDELMRMPLIVKSATSPANIINRQVSMLDIAPTISEWMGVENSPLEFDGFSLVPLIEEGDKGKYREGDSALYAYEWYNGGWFGIRAIRTPEFKFIWNPGDSQDEFYDLKNDPVEITNLVNNPNYAEQLKEMVTLLRSELVRVDDPSVVKFDHHTKVYLNSSKRIGK